MSFEVSNPHLTAHSHCTNYSVYCCDQILDRNFLNEEKFIFCLQLEGIQSLMAEKTQQQRKKLPPYIASEFREQRVNRKQSQAVNLRVFPKQPTLSSQVPPPKALHLPRAVPSSGGKAFKPKPAQFMYKPQHTFLRATSCPHLLNKSSSGDSLNYGSLVLRHKQNLLNRQTSI